MKETDKIKTAAKQHIPSILNPYHPKYWIIWMLLGFGWLLIQLLPYKMLLKLGRCLGWLMFHCDKKQRRIAKINLDLCFPELNENERDQLLRKNFISSGMAIMEAGLAWFASDKKLSPLLHLHQEKNLCDAQSFHTGVLIMGIHFVTLELAGRLFAMNHDLAIVYRENKQPFMNYLMTKIRKKHFPHAIERSNVRAIIKALKQGKSIWYTPDIDGGHYDHVFAPFFNVLAATITAPSRLAKITQAKSLVSSYFRRDDGKGYDLHLSPMIGNFPTDHIEDDITLVNQLIEKEIRKKPEQYLWQYMRFKTRPAGEKRFYNPKK